MSGNREERIAHRIELCTGEPFFGRVEIFTDRDALGERSEPSGLPGDGDASMFFPHRVMNLRKVCLYIPAKLNDVLLRFAAGCRVGYDAVARCVEEMCGCAHALGWPVSS